MHWSYLLILYSLSLVTHCSYLIILVLYLHVHTSPINSFHLSLDLHMSLY